MKKLGMFLMSKKGFTVLQAMINLGFKNFIEFVVVGEDKDVLNDYSSEMKYLCDKNSIDNFRRDEQEKASNAVDILLAISWRWILNFEKSQRLIVLHDSILPKYRGFAPLVSALLNKEREIGVTALFATDEFDKGDIIDQSTIIITYPIKIEEAIDKISECYINLTRSILEKIRSKTEINCVKQIESEATYSLWRNEDDYRIDWNQESGNIQSFVNTLGFPYKGAFTFAGNSKIRILDVELVKDVIIENRAPGKVLFVKEQKPIVVCGAGLLKINVAIADTNQKSAIPFNKFRIRFH